MRLASLSPSFYQQLTRQQGTVALVKQLGSVQQQASGRFDTFTRQQPAAATFGFGICCVALATLIAAAGKGGFEGLGENETNIEPFLQNLFGNRFSRPARRALFIHNGLNDSELSVPLPLIPSEKGKKQFLGQLFDGLVALYTSPEKKPILVQSFTDVLSCADLENMNPLLNQPLIDALGDIGQQLIDNYEALGE